MEKTADHTKLYLLVFIGLGVLTACTVGLSYMNLPMPAALSLAGLIALTKCTLIAAIFMHLKWERRMIYVLIVTGLFLVSFLVYWLIQDLGVGAF